MAPTVWQPVTQLMTGAVETGVFPGAVLLVGNRRRILYENAFGVANLYTNQPVSLKTVYDLASLTKPLATTLAMMRLVQAGILSVNTCLGELLPKFRGTPKQMIQIRHLLYHTSGLPAHRPYYKALTAIARGERSAALRRLLVAEPLVRDVGAASEYSDVGFMVLSWVVEEITQRRLDAFVSEKIYRPLGLRLFFVDLAKPRPNLDFAAGEQCPWRKILVTGAVSDDNAWVVGGIEGHAGLFGRAVDVYLLLKMLLETYIAGGAGLGVSQALVKFFLTRDAHSGRALGFDTPALKGSSSGSRFSRATVGHLGYTGTSFWMDPEKEVVVVLLSNRIHPDRENNRIREFRPRIHDAIMDVLSTGCG